VTGPNKCDNFTYMAPGKKIKLSLIILIFIVLLTLLFSLTDCKNTENESLSKPSINSTESINLNKKSNTTNEESNPTESKETSANRDNIKKETANEVLFSFAVSGDSRPANDYLPQPEKFISILNNIKKFSPAFYINTGDIINGGTANSEILEREFSDYLNATSILNCPVYVSPGNHDVQNDISRSYFSQLITGNEKLYYYFKYHDVFFIILDAYEKGFWGEIKGEQLLWLENLLATLKKEKVFIFIHPPVYSVMNPDCITNGSLHVAFSDKQNQNYIRDIFSENNVDGVFSGHEHMFYKQRIGDTEYIITACSGAFPYVSKEKGGFYHFLMIDVKQNSWIFKVFDENGKFIEQEEINFN
jgi:Icc protein